MRRARRWGDGMVAAALICLAATACGSTTKLPEAPSSGALVASHISVSTTGNALATVDPGSVTFMVDDSGTLVAHCRVTSTANTAQTVTIRGSLVNTAGSIVGDVTGGVVGLPPRSSTVVELSGPAPNGTIARVTFEVTTQSAPTPTAATPPGALGTPAA